MPMHYNQMLPPISRMARMNLGGLPTTEEEVEVITETPEETRDLGTYGGEVIEDTDVNSAGFRIKTGGQWRVIDPNDEMYQPATAEVTTPTAKPDVTVDYGTHDGQTITGVTETSAGTQVTLEDGSKAIVNKEDLTDKTVTIDEGTTRSGVPPVGGQEPPVPPITLQTPEGASFEVTEEDASDGTVTGPGGRTFKVKKAGDNWVMVTDEGQTNDLTSLGKGLMESFGIDKSDIMKTLLVYLGGRITGGSHGGSLQYALKYGLKHMEAREAQAAKTAANNKVVSSKNETMVLERTNGTSENITVRVDKTKGGVEQRSIRWKGQWIPENRFYEVLGDTGAAIRGFTEGDTGRADVKRWKDIKDGYTTHIHNQFLGDVEAVGKKKGAAWADQIATYGRENLSNTSEESLSAFNSIVYTAIDMATRDQSANARDHKKGVDVTDIRPYLEMARMGAYSGAGNSIWLTNPEETNPRDYEFVDSVKVNHLMSQMNSLAATNLGADASKSQKYLETKDIFNRLYNAYRNPANQAAIDAQYGKNIPEGMNKFTYFATSILEDANISEEERKKYGITTRG